MGETVEWAKYRSRKFMVTLVVLAVTYHLAYVAKMDAHVAMVLASIIVSYNYMQGRSDEKIIDANR